MMITQKIEMDLSKGGEMPRIKVTQNDKYSRNIELSLFSNGEAWTIPEDATWIVHYLKHDGTGGSYDELPDGTTACAVTGNRLTIALAPQVCTAAGIVQMSVSLIKGHRELHTFPVILYVQSNPEVTAESETYISLSGVVPYSGWTPNMYLGTDASGSIAVKQAPGESGSCSLAEETITVDDSGEAETVAVTGLRLDLTSYSAKVGDGFYINPVITPSSATNKSVTWKSSATGIATVDGNGYVECIAEGDAVITCTTADGRFTATCAVSVAAAESGGDDSGETEVTLSSISATYNGGDVAVGTAVTDLTGITVTATYSDGSTATVTDYTLSGTITEGSNTVTVSYGGKTTTFTVTGVAESSGGMVQLSTLGLESGLLKADGTATSLSSTYHVTAPYTNGMFVSTGMNANWNSSTYPPVIVYDGGAYSAPGFTKADSTVKVGGKEVTQFTATLTGYSENAVVYANIYSGDTDGSVEAAMNDSEIYYYIPGGEN